MIMTNAANKIKETVELMQELDGKAPEWRKVCKGFIDADTFATEAQLATEKLTEAVQGKADEKGAIADDVAKASLSGQMVMLARKAGDIDTFKRMTKAMRQHIKEGFTLDQAKVKPSKVPQSFRDACSACYKAFELGTLDKGNSTEQLKKLNKKAREATSAETPTGFNDFVHLLKKAYDDANITKGAESPAQLAILADLKGLADKYSKAAKVATGGKTPTPVKTTVKPKQGKQAKA